MVNLANYYDEWRTSQHGCRRCDWVGPGTALVIGEVFAELTEFDCPSCGEKLLLVGHPSTQESRDNWEKLDDGERRHVEAIERFRDQFQHEKLRSADDLPDVSADQFAVIWDFVNDDPSNSRTVMKVGDRVLFSEPAVYEGYERFAEVARILKAKYGSHVKDLIPTERSRLYLYGDRLSALEFIDRVRRELSS